MFPQSGFYFDPMYLVFVIPALLLSMYAQYRVQSAYGKWSKVENQRGANGAEVAQTVLPNENMGDVRVELSQGQLSDHYDPQKNILRLSPAVAQQPSIASMSIAAHEIGHASQDRDGYFWLRLRAGVVPLLSMASTIGYLVFLGGLYLQSTIITWIGVFLISGSAIFALITLPVELDASNRALGLLDKYRFIATPEEQAAARDMLNAAALTYIAGAAQAIAQVLYYVFALSGRSSRRR